MARLSTRRLAKELKELSVNPPDGLAVEDADDYAKWRIVISGAPGTIYEGERFTLEFKFTPSYPLEAPEVIFVVPNVPIHPHIYSNGHICLNILYKDWSPVQTVAQVCLSIQSMLSSCNKKELPPDNAAYVAHAHISPKKTAWAFHDDTV